MSRVALRRLTGGSRWLLSVEFPGDSSGTGLAAALAGVGTATPAGVGTAAPPGHGDAVAVWRLDPVTTVDLFAEVPGYRELAAACADAFVASGAPPGRSGVLLGYCSAARFAHHLTLALSRRDRRPEGLILVNPGQPVAADVWREYGTLCHRLGGPTPGPLPAGLLEHPPAALELMTTRLATRAAAAASRFPPEEAADFVAEVVGRYRAWLWFLLQAAAAPPPPVDCPVRTADATVDAVMRAVADLRLAPPVPRGVTEGGTA